MTKNKNSEREKIKLEIAAIVSENKEFLKSIDFYRHVAHHTILAGCKGLSAKLDTLSSPKFMVIGTPQDIESWRKRHDAALAMPYLLKDMVPNGAGAQFVADVAVKDIMSMSLLQWIDEEIYVIYSTHSNTHSHNNVQKNRATIIRNIIKSALGDIITNYITRHIFWASACTTSNQFLAKDHPWILDWCKLPPTDAQDTVMTEVADPKEQADTIEKLLDDNDADTEEIEADTLLTHAALLVKIHQDDPLIAKQAIDLLNVATDTYWGINEYRKAAMATVLLAELYCKQKRYYIALSCTKDALSYLDQKLDKELIKHCKMLLPPLEALSKNEHSSAQIPPTFSAGTTFNGFSMTTDSNTAPLNKPHIIVTKPPIVVPMDYSAKTAKKRPEARKHKKPKTAPPPAEETNVDFIKAAVAGKLFNDDNDT